MSDRYDPAEIKRRLPFLRLIEHDGIQMRRSGPHWVCCCPFHDERSPSFTVHAPEFDHGHCYGCGWNGDALDYWMARRGVDFSSALADLASLASVSPSAYPKQATPVPRMTARGPNEKKPALPRLRPLGESETAALAVLRKLSAEGVAAAAAERRVGWAAWPQWVDRDGLWQSATDAAPCWVVTDRERRLAQFRRFDGAPFKKWDGREFKAWTLGSPTWPLGASEIGDRMCVIMVEGGADMLAGYHFLARFWRLRDVAVVAMLGGSCRIAEDALPFFARRRVRIMMDEDPPKGELGIRLGTEAAARWSNQLAAAGAAVETFSFAGLTQRDGAAVKDLNDLAEVDEAAWLDPELREAFFDFDF